MASSGSFIGALWILVEIHSLFLSTNEDRPLLYVM
jgi:hypothetical protein